MEPDGVLAIVAGVASTFIGFTGVIFAVGRSSRGGWTAAERTALLNLLMPSIVVLFLAFIPIVAAIQFIMLIVPRPVAAYPSPGQ